MDIPVHLDPVTDASSMPLEQIDVSDPQLYQDATYAPYFERLRREAPVHYRKDGKYGSFWSVTRYKDITHVELHPEVYSSEAKLGGITITDRPVQHRRSSFISMDPPRHEEHRKVVSPIFAPASVSSMSSIIREQTCTVLDRLPRGETFDWVEHVSIELSTAMLAILLGFPLDEKRKLAFWSDVASLDVNAGGLVDSEEKRLEILREALQVFTDLWRKRAAQSPHHDLISMLAHGESTKYLVDDPMSYLGNLALLMVGGNDTTRNSMSGGLLAFCLHPDEYRRLREHPELIPHAVQETIRWQTPVAHMRRTALADVTLAGQQIRAGDKVVLWYVSANRDAESIDRPDEFIIDRAQPQRHLGFGIGVHRCVGARLAELQLAILWEEVTKRFPRIELMAEPKRLYNNWVCGITEMQVRIPA